MQKTPSIDDFWNWFRTIASSLATDLRNRSLVGDLDQRINNLGPRLSWEIGPGLIAPCQLVISPDLNPDLRTRAHAIVAAAPEVAGWEFHSARKSKVWDYKFTLERSAGQGHLQFDATEWSFVLVQYPDESYGVVLQGVLLPSLNEDERWQAAAIVLESILGEEFLMDKISEFELVDRMESQFAGELRPLWQLREALVGT